ncbi:polyketide antibiotic transporter [Amycolatopsis sp. NPDC058340]|uniref:polyketide antibiotic transporter n=1 Tax=Amycolatopsis sp. NPDC058340 TaxID=3346453 RepID=UPI00365DA02E
MTTTVAKAITPRGKSTRSPRTGAGRAVFRRAARRIRRGALIVALVTAGMSAVVAGQYQSTFAGALDGAALRALAENPAIRILFGPPVALDDPGGFTVWRTGTPVQVLVAVWALLVATRLTRGEEDTGRTDLLLAGRLRAVDVLAKYLIALASAAVVIAGAVALALVATGTRSSGALVHAGGILGMTLTFAATGVFAAQLMPTRAAATGLAVAVLGAGLLLRMLADGIGALAWAGWITPFGLTSRSLPYAGDKVGPLLVLAVFPVVLTGMALIACSRRDVGRALVNPAGRRRPRTRLLKTITGFAVRRALRSTIGWAAGLGAYFFLIGALVVSVVRFLGENARFAELAAGAGFGGLETIEGFAAAMFSLLAIPAGLYAATRVAAFAADESGRRLTSLLALPLSRHRLAVTEVVVTAVGVLVLLTAAAFAFWSGTVAGSAELGLGAALTGAWNVAPVASLSLGAAMFALGWAPRAVAALGALPVAGGFLLKVILQSVQAPRWLSDLSPFTHLAAVPRASPDWTATLGLLAIAAALAGLGFLGYHRRDLST